MRRNRQRTIASVLLFVFACGFVAEAVDSRKAAYFGGTAVVFANAKDPIEGRLDTANTEALILSAICSVPLPSL